MLNQSACFWQASKSYGMVNSEDTATAKAELDVKGCYYFGPIIKLFEYVIIY
jgi:hypothetical protein